MITAALTLFAIAIGSAVLGTYASPDQGLNHILYWFAVTCLGVAGGFVLLYLGVRRYSD